MCGPAGPRMRARPFPVASGARRGHPPRSFRCASGPVPNLRPFPALPPWKFTAATLCDWTAPPCAVGRWLLPSPRTPVPKKPLQPVRRWPVQQDGQLPAPSGAALRAKAPPFGCLAPLDSGHTPPRRLPVQSPRLEFNDDHRRLLPLARRRSVSARALACHVGDSISASVRHNPPHSLYIRRNLSPRCNWSAAASNSASVLMLAKMPELTTSASVPPRDPCVYLPHSAIFSRCDRVL